MSRSIKVRLSGIFGKAYGSEEISVEVEKGEKLRDIIQKLAESSPELGRVLIDPELRDPRPNAVILVNGKEISALEGLETRVENQDKVVLIPVIHGG